MRGIIETYTPKAEEALQALVMAGDVVIEWTQSTSTNDRLLTIKSKPTKSRDIESIRALVMSGIGLLSDEQAEALKKQILDGREDS